MAALQMKDGFPVAPGQWPIVGHLPHLLRHLPAFHARARAACGPTYWVHSGFGAWQLTYGRADALSIFKSKVADSSYMKERSYDLLGDSLIVMDGIEHMRVRGILNPSFTPKGLTSASVGQVVAEVMERRVQHWLQQPRVAIVPETREIALDIIFQLIGIPATDLPAWRHAYEEFLFTAINIPIDLPGFPKWRGRKASRWLGERLRALVAKARTKEEPGNLLERMALARGEDGEQVEEGPLVDNIRLLALAGHETTASTMAWMAIHLASEPRWWEAVVEEARSVGSPPMSPAELRRFPVTEAVFREALRLHPPVAADARRVMGPFELDGKPVPLKTVLGIPIYSLYRDPEVYPEPEAFRPERWLNKEIVNSYETIAFGGGPHFCLGYHVAWMEAVHFGVRLALSATAAGKRWKTPTGVRERYVPFVQPHAKINLIWE